MKKGMKLCRDCTLIYGEKWTLVPAEAKHHADRYPKHKIVDEKDVPVKEKAK